LATAKGPYTKADVLLEALTISPQNSNIQL
jgi:hypothetical protein